MGRHRIISVALATIFLVYGNHAARVIDTAESTRTAKGAGRQAVQPADQQWVASQKKKLGNQVQLHWPEEPEQDVFSLSFPEVPVDLPPDYAAQLAALYNNNTVVRLSGAGMKKDVAIPLNGTVTITARDAWSPVRGSTPFGGATVAQNPAGAPTAFSYRGDLMCGIFNVGSCGLSGQLLPVQTLGRGRDMGWDSMVVANCNLNSNAGLYCSRLFQSGMRITAEGLASVIFDAAETVQSIDAGGLAITSIYYIDGPQSLIGELLSAVSTTLGYTGGSLSILAGGRTPQGRYMGNATFDLRK